jgi:serine/threonine protein kinase
LLADGMRAGRNSEPLKRREKTIGNYAIIKTIGEGRYGKVKLAEHLVSRKKVAVKIMKKAQMEAADLARIKRELRVMTVLDHPNIVKLYQVIDTPETTCIVMEFCSGGDLYDYISTYRRLSVPNALKIFRQIVAGLLYCHQHLVIHRDVRSKPPCSFAASCANKTYTRMGGGDTDQAREHPSHGGLAGEDRRLWL